MVKVQNIALNNLYLSCASMHPRHTVHPWTFTVPAHPCTHGIPSIHGHKKGRAPKCSTNHQPAGVYLFASKFRVGFEATFANVDAFILFFS